MMWPVQSQTPLFSKLECVLFFIFPFFFTATFPFPKCPFYMSPVQISNCISHPLFSFSHQTEQTLCSQNLPLLFLSFMELQRRQDQSLSQRKGQKRKLDDEHHDEGQISAAPPTADERAALLYDVAEQVSVLESTFTWNEVDRSAAKRATHALADLAKNGKSMPPISPCVAVFVWIAVAVCCFFLCVSSCRLHVRVYESIRACRLCLQRKW